MYTAAVIYILYCFIARYWFNAYRDHCSAMAVNKMEGVLCHVLLMSKNNLVYLSCALHLNVSVKWLLICIHTDRAEGNGCLRHSVL